MARIAGIKVEKDSRGNPRYIRFDLQKYGRELEDIIDRLQIEMHRDEPTTSWEKIKKQMCKKHGVKCTQ